MLSEEYSAAVLLCDAMDVDFACVDLDDLDRRRGEALETVLGARRDVGTLVQLERGLLDSSRMRVVVACQRTTWLALTLVENHRRGLGIYRTLERWATVGRQ